MYSSHDVFRRNACTRNCYVDQRCGARCSFICEERDSGRLLRKAFKSLRKGKEAKRADAKRGAKKQRKKAA